MVITLNGIKKDIPDCYERLTTRQYERLLPELAKEPEARDHFKMFQVIADTDFKGFEPNEENEVTIWNAVKWIYEQPFMFTEALAPYLEIKGKILTIPSKVNKLSIGQNIHLKQLLAKSKYLEENLSSACAIYLQPIYDGKKFDHDSAMELKKVIEQMPAYLIRPIGFFLLTSALPNGTKPTSFLRRILNSLKVSSVKMLQCLPGFRGFNHLKIYHSLETMLRGLV